MAGVFEHRRCDIFVVCAAINHELRRSGIGRQLELYVAPLGLEFDWGLVSTNMSRLTALGTVLADGQPIDTD